MSVGVMRLVMEMVGSQPIRLALLWQIFAADERDGIERSRWRGS